MSVNSITNGAFPTVLGSQFNNTLGTIDFTGGTTGTPPTGDQLICTINCTSKSATGISKLDFVIDGGRRDAESW